VETDFISEIMGVMTLNSAIILYLHNERRQCTCSEFHIEDVQFASQ